MKTSVILCVISLICAVRISNSADVDVYHNRALTVAIPANQTVTLRLNDILSNITHIVIQAHSQWRNLTLSESADNSIVGSNIGLLSLLHVSQKSAKWNLASPYNHTVNAVVLATVYSRNDPIPGGCNMEFRLENDPNMHLTHTNHASKVQYAEANTGPIKRGSVSSCGKAQSLQGLSYELYELWLHERDLSPQHYNHSLMKMLHPTDIRIHAEKVSDFTHNNGKTLRMFASYNGQGVIYNTVVKYTDSSARLSTEAAYVPVITYSCNDKNCSKSVGDYVYFALLGILGCVLCFGGHRLFMFELFVFGALSFHIVSFVLISHFTSLNFTESMLVAWVPALAGGFVWLLVWLLFGVPVFSVLLVGLVLGYVFATVVFYLTPFGELSWWKTEFNFAMGFSCAILIVPVIFLAFLKFMSMVSCAVVGSYLAVLAIDVCLDGSLHEIYLNSFRKAVLKDYIRVDTAIPFQFTDVILCITWASLTLFGFLTQQYLMRNRPPFPKSPASCVPKRRRRNYAINNYEPDENTSLLRHAPEVSAETETAQRIVLVTEPPPIVDPL